MNLKFCQIVLQPTINIMAGAVHLSHADPAKALCIGLGRKLQGQLRESLATLVKTNGSAGPETVSVQKKGKVDSTKTHSEAHPFQQVCIAKQKDA